MANDNDVMDQMISATMTMSNMASLMNKTCENLGKGLKEVKIEINDMRTEINGMSSEIKDLKNEQKETNKHMDKLEDNTLLDPMERREIKLAANARVHKLLRNETPAGWSKYSHTFYAKLYWYMNNYIGVPSSGYIRKIDLKCALDFINSWEPLQGVEGLKALVDARKDDNKKDKNKKLPDEYDYVENEDEKFELEI